MAHVGPSVDALDKPRRTLHLLAHLVTKGVSRVEGVVGCRTDVVCGFVPPCRVDGVQKGDASAPAGQGPVERDGLDSRDSASQTLSRRRG